MVKRNSMQSVGWAVKTVQGELAGDQMGAAGEVQRMKALCDFFSLTT